MNKQVSLPCGLSKDGKLIYIEDAENGLKCECFCPACKQALVAKNGGKKREHHFAHLNVVECEHGYQSALHYMAKDIFLELQYLTFIKNGNPVQYKIDSVVLECKVDEVIPDIFIVCDGKRFFVEIYVTHAVDDIKKQKIQDMRISAIEIDLSRFHHEMITKEELREEIVNPQNFSWIYDADVDLIKDKKEVIQQFGFKRYLQIDNSIGCPYLVNVKDSFGLGLGQFVPLEFCIRCHNCVWDGKSNYISCGHTLPMPLNFETRKKIFADIIVNENKVMFASEFKKYSESFKNRLQSAMQQQYYRFMSLGRALNTPSVSYSSPTPRHKNNNSRNYRSYHKKRK
ncbi:competence protein CoiA family protein [Treponema sp.]|uniref:competence protein CoiA family protein n=1 Tax=Treponema sp. TaxID=166 RepID=UPI00298D6EE6|nr:competence protein CoiA family protein [Treponema sp.]MCR5613409.1 hypothetical protein [Treponema sp.]